MNNNTTLKERVYDYIVNSIHKGDLKAGEKINENIICDELNVSRTPVREALIVLSSEGVLEAVPRKGFVIKPLTEKEAEELYAVIGALDGLAAKLACGNIEEEILSEMEFYTLSMDLAIEKENYNMYYKQQELFHNLYMDRCGNDSLVNLILELKRKLLKRSYEIEDPEDKKKILFTTNSQHKEMLEMFKAGEAAKLQEYMAVTHWKTEKAIWESFRK